MWGNINFNIEFSTDKDHEINNILVKSIFHVGLINCLLSSPVDAGLVLIIKATKTICSHTRFSIIFISPFALKLSQMLHLDSRRVKLYNTAALRVSVLHKLSVDHQF